MSMKERRNVTFEVPELSEPNNNSDHRPAGKAGNREDSRSRSRARSRSWSRFRARRTKSQDTRSARDTSASNGMPVGLKRDRSLTSLVRTGSRNSVRSLVKLFEVRSMNEGRKSQIVLLDERRLDIIIQPKLYSSELLDLVASHFKLKEKQYFGLGFIDDTNHFNWLQGEKRVLDHEFPKKTGLLVLHFAIKFYVDTIGLLRDIQTVELFYLNARQLVFRGQLECDTETVFELSAHVLQATNGDFVSDEETREELKKLPVIPTSTLKQHPSIAYCEDRVIHFYDKISGTSRGLAIVNYMTIVEKLPTYGIHYYDVKDKKDIPWWLGISPKGIAVYDKNDKTTPRKLFTWKNLENLYYRDKKFSIEVHGPKRDETGSHIIHTVSSFNAYEDANREQADGYDDLSTAMTDPTTQMSVSRRTFGASNVDVHAWFASTSQLTKCIWSMAVVQHQFYLDRKQSRSQLPTARSMSEIAADLCRSTTSLPGSLGSDLSRSPSSHSLPSLSNSRYDLTIEQSDSLKAERDMMQALKARREALEDTLRKKTEELKLLCLQEGELTGELPLDYPLISGEQAPVFRRRVGTSFSLSVKNVQDTDQLCSELSKLELEVELQGKITAAAHRLASDKTVSKYVRKQRRQSYSKALGKMKDMEKKLDDMRKKIGKPSTTEHHTSRSLDGMYSVLHPCSKYDLDSVLVHELCTNSQEHSGGSVWHGGGLGVHDDRSSSKYASSGYLTSGTSSPGSRSCEIISDDSSSLSDSLSTMDSARDIVAGDSQSLEFNVPRKVSTHCRDGNQILQQFQLRRRKHLIAGLSRNESFREFKEDMCSSKTSTNVCLEGTDLVMTEQNYRTDYKDECHDDKERGQKYCTRVQRRKSNFIARKIDLKNFHIELPHHNGFERGWKLFEQILMGDDDDVFCEGKITTRCRGSRTSSRLVGAQNFSNSSRFSDTGEADPSHKIQELTHNDGPRRPVRRSCSFDHSHSMRIARERSSDNMKHSSSISPRKSSFIFLTQRRNKPKEIHYGLHETQYNCTLSNVEPHTEVSDIIIARRGPFISDRCTSESEQIMSVQNGAASHNNKYAQSSDIFKYYTQSCNNWPQQSLSAAPATVLCPQQDLDRAGFNISYHNQHSPTRDNISSKNSITSSLIDHQHQRRKSSSHPSTKLNTVHQQSRNC